MAKPNRSRFCPRIGMSLIAAAALATHTSAAPASSGIALSVSTWDAMRPIPGDPRTVHVRNDPALVLRAEVARGEVESASILISTDSDVTEVSVGTTALIHADGQSRLSDDSIHIRLVKAWYQAGLGTINKQGGRFLVSELLLHDDSLVRVDPVARKNYLRVTVASDPVYIDVTNSTERLPQGSQVRDAKTLLPFSIRAGEPRQIWLTFRIPETAKSGIYRGSLEIRLPTGVTRDVPMELDVLPFILEPSPLEYSIYYRGRLRNAPQEALGANEKTRHALAAELADLYEHGIRTLTFYNYGWKENELLEEDLELRAQAGFSKEVIYVLGLPIGSPTEPKALEELSARMKTWLRRFRSLGFRDVYFYGLDEAKGAELERQRAAWEALRDAGGRTVAANKIGDFTVVGDVLDTAVVAYEPDATEAARYHAVGHRILNYANPQIGVEDPDIYRRNYGIRLLLADYDGAMNYAYQHAVGNIWDDFDGTAKYRDHVFAYPTTDGIVGTIQWEGFREAIDDVRYVATLRKALAARNDSAARHEAETWIRSLSKDVDLTAVRQEIIRRIRRAMLPPMTE